jgi:hypothetical protein
MARRDVISAAWAEPYVCMVYTIKVYGCGKLIYGKL